MEVDIPSLLNTIETLENNLLASRVSHGYWEGRLSSSALSTATAVFALHMVDGNKYQELIEKGLSWLSENQNENGGWGDTIKSPSNLSTTLLCYSSLGIVKTEARYANVIRKTEGWLIQRAGSLDAEILSKALDEKYGKDKTFSVPILTMCALADRLGENPWRLIKSLPFELAVFPHWFYKWLRLPVVSYALPALIAIGQVKYHHLKPRNPLTRFLRGITRNRCLKILTGLQPDNGGFLEATPLTSFVVLSLAGSGNKNHEVVNKGIDFLIDSIREDGSWPIDTNLATWVTTLSLNALAVGDGIKNLLSEKERKQLLDWLLSSQHRRIHPYTHAAPGGWAWTDMPGAVPDGDDTSGVLISLYNLGITNEQVLNAVTMGIQWLLNLQNKDGGIPTFCRGWSNLAFDRSAPDITAHALAAMFLWIDSLPPALQNHTHKAIDNCLNYLESIQRKNGSWIPLWFGNEFTSKQENPVYGTARVLSYLSKMPVAHQERLRGIYKKAIEWLIAAQNQDGGWGGDKDVQSSIEETALSVDALAEVLLIMRKTKSFIEQSTTEKTIEEVISRGVDWIIVHTDKGKSLSSSPIGLYFARLWYYEELYPAVFSLSALKKTRKFVRE